MYTVIGVYGERERASEMHTYADTLSGMNALHIFFLFTWSFKWEWVWLVHCFSLSLSLALYLVCVCLWRHSCESASCSRCLWPGIDCFVALLHANGAHVKQDEQNTRMYKCSCLTPYFVQMTIAQVKSQMCSQCGSLAALSLSLSLHSLCMFSSNLEFFFNSLSLTLPSSVEQVSKNFTWKTAGAQENWLFLGHRTDSYCCNGERERAIEDTSYKPPFDKKGHVWSRTKKWEKERCNEKKRQMYLIHAK